MHTHSFYREKNTNSFNHMFQVHKLRINAYILHILTHKLNPMKNHHLRHKIKHSNAKYEWDRKGYGAAKNRTTI